MGAGTDAARPSAQDVIVVGGSAGALESLLTLVSEFPPDLPAAMLVALHTSRSGGSTLPGILSRRGPLPAEQAEDGEALVTGRIYVAPSGVHLEAHPGRARLDTGPKENGHRPAIDRLFRTAAQSYGPHTLGILLSGGRHDGAAGCVSIKATGGTVLVQDPSETAFPEMPSSAIAMDHPDEVLAVGRMADRVARHLERGEADRGALAPDANISGNSEGSLDLEDLGCPSCGGSLRLIDEADAPRFRCHVGHTFSIQALADQQADTVEAALWTSLRLLKERASVARRIAARRQSPGIRAVFEERAAEADQHAGTLERLLAEQIRSSAE